MLREQLLSIARQYDAAAGSIEQELRFGTFQNAQVTLNGQAVSSGQTVTIPANTTSLVLTVTRVTAGQPTQVPFTVVDTCGEWPTFVGGGASAF